MRRAPPVYVENSVFFVMNDSGFLFRFREELPAKAGESAADGGTDDEDPDDLYARRALVDDREDRGAEAPGGVDGRAGVVDADDVYGDEAETDDETGDLGGVLKLGGHAENKENEDEGEDDLNEEASDDAFAARAEQAVGAVVARCLEAVDAADEEGAEQTARELRADVAAELLDGEPAVDEQPRETAGLMWQPEILPME